MGQIKKSVGKGGQNEEEDVQAVQELLNKFTNLGGYSKLKEDGKCGPKTLAAIGAFQKNVLNMTRPDQRVDPGRDTFKKLNENPSAVAKAAKEEAAKEDEKKDKEESKSAGKGGGKVTGKTSGVKQYILDFLQAVADHYGKEIYVTSGLRSINKQAEVMWTFWTKTVDRGRKYIWLRSHEPVRQQLDDWWTEGHKKDGDKSCEEKFKSKVVELAKSGVLSRHLSGQAVDIALNVDKNVFKVLDMHMQIVEEKDQEGEISCYHFDDRKKPPSPVTDAIKAKWPKA
jgi:hypothetical protein